MTNTLDDEICLHIYKTYNTFGKLDGCLQNGISIETKLKVYNTCFCLCCMYVIASSLTGDMKKQERFHQLYIEQQMYLSDINIQERSHSTSIESTGASSYCVPYRHWIPTLQHRWYFFFLLVFTRGEGQTRQFGF